MFKRSQNTQGDLFSGISSHISDRKQKMLSDPDSWHNIFYREIVSRIDEEIYSVLFYDNNGRPNAPIRVLLGMMFLKEGNGWSDEQLFEQCRFNVKVMMALGYMNLDEDIPVESTYYFFRKQLLKHNEEHGTDLIKKSFEKITKEQVLYYNVSGKKVRLDSKLINSNIALCTRLDMIMETVRVFIRDLGLSRVENDLSKEDYELLMKLQKKSTTNLTYPLSKEDKVLLLQRMGQVVKVLLNHYVGQPNYKYLQRMYKEQYKEVIKQKDDSNDTSAGDKNVSTPQAKEANEVSSSSMQSIHDPEAAYRAKGQGKSKKHINGYHANLTETCDEGNKFNLIVDVQLEKANVNENEFLIEAIESSEKLLQDAKGDAKGDAKDGERIIKQANTDGGFDSDENRKKMAEQDMPQWNMAKAKGGEQVFEMSYDDAGNLQAIDKRTGKKADVKRASRVDKIVIKVQKEDQTYEKRYFTDKQIENYINLQNIKSKYKEEDRNLRANVESTVHQGFHRLLKRDKIKYRGQYKCKMYVISRVLWVNFRRIQKNLTEKTACFMFLLLCCVIGRHTIGNKKMVAA